MKSITLNARSFESVVCGWLITSCPQSSGHAGLTHLHQVGKVLRTHKYTVNTTQRGPAMAEVRGRGTAGRFIRMERT